MCKKKIPVLVVEDDPDNALLIKMFLKDSPYAVEWAKDGWGAMEKIQSGKPYPLILMDIQMPQMDGLETTRRIRDWEKAQGAEPVPIIALTAHATDEDEKKSLAAGCNKHLTKPIARKKLRDLLDSYGLQEISGK